MTTFLDNVGATFTIQEAGLHNIGKTDHKFVGTIAVHLVNTSSFSGTITVQARVWPSATTDAAAPTITPVTHAYLSYYLNGSAVIPSGLVATGITTTSLIFIPATGVQIFLDTTAAYTSGTMTVYVEPCAGAAA